MRLEEAWVRLARRRMPGRGSCSRPQVCCSGALGLAGGDVCAWRGSVRVGRWVQHLETVQDVEWEWREWRRSAASFRATCAARMPLSACRGG